VNPSRARALDLRRFFDLTLVLAITEFKLRYFGNVLGYFWTLAKPVVLFGVLYVAFTEFVHFGKGISHYPEYLLAAIVLFTYFQEATTKSVTSLVDNESLIRKIPMPLMAIPLSISLDAAFNLGLNLIAVLVFVLAGGVQVGFSWLALPALVAVLVVFSTATGALLANLFVLFRDVRQIWEVVVQLAFWATPIVYTISFVHSDFLRHLIMASPLAAIVVQMRHSLIDHSAPSAAAAAGGVVWLLIPAAIVLGMVGLSIYLHKRVAPSIAERL
jgi:ABC-2 type transport system permease protein